MKKLMMITLIFFLLGGMSLFADEIELGMSVTPIPGEVEKGESESDDVEVMPGFHAGYSFLGILYGSFDALVAPPSMINGMTGFYRPGFINLIDAGFRFKLGPVMLLTTVGVNQLYVHNQDDLEGDWESDLGANLRLGAGYRRKHLGVTVTATQTFNNFDAVVDTIGGLFDDERRDNAVARLTNGLIPTISVVLYL